jgi:hypothetical protein
VFNRKITEVQSKDAKGGSTYIPAVARALFLVFHRKVNEVQSKVAKAGITPHPGGGTSPVFGVSPQSKRGTIKVREGGATATSTLKKKGSHISVTA